MNMEKTILTTEEVIQMTGVKRKTLDYYCWKKLIPYSQPNGRMRYFKKGDVEDFFLGTR